MGGNSLFSRGAAGGDDGDHEGAFEGSAFDEGAHDVPLDVGLDVPIVDPLDDPPRGVGTAEGVRVIGASEAAEVVGRGDAVRRKSGQERRLGDRPEDPPVDRKAALRFPLSEEDDPAAIERPRPLAAEPRLSVSDGTGQHPVISLGSATAEHELPHWTSSATGEIPRVVVGEQDGTDDQAWSTYAAAGPRWRDQSATGWDEDSFADLAEIDDDDAVNVGALSVGSTVVEDEGLTHDEYLGFDDLDMPDAAPPQADLSMVSTRGSASDPIRIGAGDHVPAPPTGPRARSGVAAPRPASPGEAGASGAPRDIRAAAQYGVGIAVVAALCFAFGTLTTTLLVTLVLFVSVGEFYSAVKKLGFLPLAPVGLAATAALPLAAYAKGEAGVPLVLFIALLVGAVWYILGVAEEHPLANLGVTLLGIVYVGVFGCFAALMLRLDAVPGHEGNQGIGVLLLAVVGTVAYDVGGLFGGRSFGRRPLSKASPNKTLEGLLSGCLAAVVAVFLVGAFAGPLSGAQLLLLGVAIAVVAPIGDLAESVMKRDLGIKDFSNLIPGHGGVLDRFDSLLFVLPATYYVVRALLNV